MTEQSLPSPRPPDPTWPAVIIAIVLCLGVAFGGIYLYRQQHCMQLFGHWIDLTQPAPYPLVCQ